MCSYYENDKSSVQIQYKDECRKQTIEDISCVLNREVNKNIGIKASNTKKIHCKTDQNEVYVPFSFIKHYYEARGDFTKDKPREFEISHSYSKVYTPTSK